jgi:hypothetical protein
MWSIFKNDNEWNEKTVVGFIAFLVMVLFALARFNNWIHRKRFSNK